MSMFYVPFIRTLKKASDTVVQRVKTVVVSTEDREEVTSEYEIPQEKVLRYIAPGNYKWSVPNRSICARRANISPGLLSKWIPAILRSQS
jgi:hypothetical protein